MDGRRHRGPLLCLGGRAKASTLEGRHRRFTGGSAFHMSFRGLRSLLAAQQEWYHHLQQVVQSLIPHNYRQYWCTQQTACSTHTHTRTVTELNCSRTKYCCTAVCTYLSIFVLFSSKFWYCTSRYRSPKQEARAPDTVNGSRRVCREKCQVIAIIGCPLILVQMHPPR